MKKLVIFHFLLVFAVGTVLWAKPPMAVHDPAKGSSPETVPTVQEAITDLKSKDPVKRRLAANILGRLKSSHAIPALIVALSDKDADVRAAVVRTLGRLRTRDALKRLNRLLIEDPDGHVRQSAANALGTIRSPESAEILAKALKDEHLGTRLSACQALASLRSVEAIPALTAVLSDSSPKFRLAVVQTLEQIGDASASAAIRPLLKDKDPAVHLAAIRTLGRLKDKSSVRGFKKFLKKKNSPEIRVAAAHALARLGVSKGRNVALEILKDTTVNRSTRLQAVYALGDMNDPTLAPDLKEIGEGEEEYLKRAITLVTDRLTKIP